MSLLSIVNDIKDRNWGALGTDIVGTAASFVPGVGPAIGAGIQAVTAGASTAFKGGSTGDVLKSAGIAGATTGIGTGVSSSLLNFAQSGSSAIKDAAVKSISGTSVPGSGSAIGEAVHNVVNGTTSNLSTISQAADNYIRSGLGTAANDVAKNGLNAYFNSSTGSAANQTAGQVAGATGSRLARAGSAAKKAAGQFGVQGVLSVASALMAAKQGASADEMQKQSFLFQQQQYKDAQAQQEAARESNRANAEANRQAALDYGARLFGSDSNNTLLSNGDPGNYSLLEPSISTRRSSDLV